MRMTWDECGPMGITTVHHVIVVPLTIGLGRAHPATVVAGGTQDCLLTHHPGYARALVALQVDPVVS